MKIMMVVNSDGALYVFRKPIIERLISEGHEVVTITPKSIYFDRIEDLGARPIELDFSRHSTSFFQNFLLLRQLHKLIQQEKPDIVHSFTHKPSIFATIAARLARVDKIFVTVTGLGGVFVRNDWKTKIVRKSLLYQYKIALRFINKIFFQNPDDMSLFERNRIVPKGRGLLTAGSGLDLREFKRPSEDDVAQARKILNEEVTADTSKKRIVLFVARGTPEKGFFEFYEAARILNLITPDSYLFVHLGHIEAQGSWHFSEQGLPEYARECGVHYLGFKENIQSYMCAADIVALPSKYGEGTPRSLIEALGLGKAIVTTDMPGCRETVIEGWNGFLCKPGDAKDLAAKILAVDDAMLSVVATRARRFCEAKYDADILVNTTLSLYGLTDKKNAI